MENTHTVEQNRELRIKPAYMQSINLQQSGQEYTMGKGQSLQQIVLRKLNSHIEESEAGISYITHKN